MVISGWNGELTVLCQLRKDNNCRERSAQIEENFRECVINRGKKRKRMKKFYNVNI